MATTEEQRRLVEKHLGLVRAQASDIMQSAGLPASIEFDDLVSFGTKGLIEAAQRFQPERGAAFATFAYYRVRGAIFDGLRSFGWVNRREYARLREQERVDAYLQSHSERTAGAGPARLEDQVAARAEALGGAATVFVTSLEAEARPDAADERPGADEVIALGELSETVRAALRELPPQERAIVEAFYFKDRNLQDAGRDLGVSKSWASRLHAAAIDKLRRRLARADEAAPPGPRPPGRPPAGGPARGAAGPARGGARPAGRRR
ncbi:MAG: sigma-70 family RNA polymerase sigma factor [Deltaproteobacteria bacterium]|nr:sigma-70 family RNA polymerase sigma factor [Deltaproteobacteria bacterium]